MMECTANWCLANRHTLSLQDDVPLLTRVDGGESCLCRKTIQGDSDIAGLGVIIAFLVSAFLTQIASGLCLLLSRSVESDGTPSFNPIDRWFRRACTPTRRFVAFCGLDPAALADALYDTVISLSDQQIAQGIAILGSAAIRTYSPSSSPLSTHHFAMIGNLAWLSSNTHLLAILVVRSYTDSSKPYSPERYDPTKTHFSSRLTRALRAILMLTLAGLLLWLSWLEGDAGLYDSVQCPAACLVNSANGKGGEPRNWMIFNFFYVFYNYTALLAPTVSRRVRVWWMDHVSLRMHPRDEMSPKPIPGFEKWANFVPATRKSWGTAPAAWHTLFWAPVKRVGGGILYVAKGLGWLLWMKEASETVSFLELLVYFSLGIYWTLGDWLEGHEKMDDRGKGETTWGFGQLVPLFLLLIPLFQLVDSYAGYLASQRREEGAEESKQLM